MIHTEQGALKQMHGSCSRLEKKWQCSIKCFMTQHSSSDTFATGWEREQRDWVMEKEPSVGRWISKVTLSILCFFPRFSLSLVPNFPQLLPGAQVVCTVYHERGDEGNSIPSGGISLRIYAILLLAKDKKPGKQHSHWVSQGQWEKQDFSNGLQRMKDGE